MEQNRSEMHFRLRCYRTPRFATRHGKPHTDLSPIAQDLILGERQGGYIDLQRFPVVCHRLQRIRDSAWRSSAMMTVTAREG